MRFVDPSKIEYVQVINHGIEGHVVLFQVNTAQYRKEFRPAGPASDSEVLEETRRTAVEYANALRRAASKAGVFFFNL